MIQVMSSSWALYLGMFMLMIGNGLQGTLLGLRGDLEGFSTFELSVIMSAYFVGFLFSSKVTPKLIGRVGHFCGADPVPNSGGALGMDLGPRDYRVLFLRRLCDGGKLVERCLHKRHPRQGLVNLSDGANGGHRGGARYCVAG